MLSLPGRVKDGSNAWRSSRIGGSAVDVAFALTAVVFLTFTIGYRTRLFHLLSLLCITSLNARNLLVENGGPVVMNLHCSFSN